MRAKKENTNVRRDQLTAAALEVIGREGVHGLSIAGVSGQAGLGASSVYRHFESKDALLDAVLDHLQQRLLRNVTEVRAEAPGAVERLRLLMERHACLLAANPAVPAIVFSDGLSAGHPGRARKIRQIIECYLGEVRAIIQEGQAEGSLKPELDPATGSVLFLGALLPAALLCQLTGGDFQILEHYRKAWPIFRQSVAVG